MPRITDEDVVMLQQSYALLDQLEVKGHQNSGVLNAAMDRIRAVLQGVAESAEKSKTAREKKVAQEEEQKEA